jgi:hypothetical protein
MEVVFVFKFFFKALPVDREGEKKKEGVRMRAAQFLSSSLL